VDGEPASEKLDMLIIPGGSLVESGGLGHKVAQEVVRMADAGKLVLGVCSGFQVLAAETDVGRLSPFPLKRSGLGLLDCGFEPLVCTDRVTATVVGSSFIAGKLGLELKGFHCHTYGRVSVGTRARKVLVSHVHRVNYKNAPQDLLSGVSNGEGNVIGILVHGLLDRNAQVVESIMAALDMKMADLEAVRLRNAALMNIVKQEVGVASRVYARQNAKRALRKPSFILVTSTASGSGKTFIVAGIAGALRKRGQNVGVLKVGGDIRDTVPALYLVKEPVNDWSSIRVGGSGWKTLYEVTAAVNEQYDIVLVEGAMNVFTGLLNDSAEQPTSTAEVAAAMGVPVIIVVGCEKEGIEGALVNVENHISLLKSLGVKVEGIVLNKVRVSYLTEAVRGVIDNVLRHASVKLLGIVPRMEIEERGMIPEVEIRYDAFGQKAIEAAEQYLDLDAVSNLASPVTVTKLDFNVFKEKFKSLLVTNMPFTLTEGVREERCS